jgi:preprotein translocase subunit SecB
MAEQIARFRFLGYKILDSHIQVAPDQEIGKQFNVTFDQTTGINESDFKMRLVLSAKIEDTNNAMHIIVKSEGYFEFDKNITDDERKVFFNMSAPAILFPYIRAYISALTSLSGINPVILPTLNLSKR